METVCHEGTDKSFARCHLRGDGWGYACIMITEAKDVAPRHQWFQVRKRDGKWETTKPVTAQVVRNDW
jgi:hypothetical protein